jgi:pSer/pThr/pTyr-binding forkhead associated (FHA) protein
VAKALTSSRRSRRVGSAMRVEDSPIPNCKSLVSRRHCQFVQYQNEYLQLTLAAGPIERSFHIGPALAAT